MDEGNSQEGLESQSLAVLGSSAPLVGNYYMGADSRFHLAIDASGVGTLTAVPPYPWNNCYGIGDTIYTGLTQTSSSGTFSSYTGTRYVNNCSAGITAHSVLIQMECSLPTYCYFYEHVSGWNTLGWTRL